MKKRFISGIIISACMLMLMGCGGTSLETVKSKANEAIQLANGYEQLVVSYGDADILAEYNEAMLGIETVVEKLEKGEVKSADYDKTINELIKYETTINNIGVNLQGR